MSDFDRNLAARGSFGANRAVAIDAGLRAYMLRVYNYMAAAVALTGVVAWFTFQAAVTTNSAGAIVGLTSFGQAIFGGPAVIVLMLATLGLVFFISFRIQHLQYTTAMALFMLYAGLLGVMLSTIFLSYTGASITRVLVFAGLTAYDTQRIKEMYDVNDDGSVSGRKAVMGALSLYLDFINLFMMLLRLVGDRR